MSHSKRRGQGRSYYLEQVNPSARRYIVSCAACDRVGFAPEVLSSSFTTSRLHQVIREELERLLRPLPLDDAGRCQACAGVAPIAERSK